MVQLAGETTSDDSTAATAAKWTVIATFSSPMLSALAENAGLQAQDVGNSRLLHLRVDHQHMLCTRLSQCPLPCYMIIVHKKHA